MANAKGKGKLTARSMAFDEDGTPYVLVREDKQLALCALIDGRLQLRRRVPLKYYWFEVATVDGKRWALLREDSRSQAGAVAACELSGSDKVKTLATPEAGSALWPWHLGASTCASGVYGLSERAIYRFAGARGWLDLDAEPDARTDEEEGAVFFAVTNNRVARRTLSAARGRWDGLYPHDYGIFREGLVFDTARGEVVVATRSELHVVKVDGGGTEVVRLGDKIWCLAAHDDALYGYTHAVVRVGRDGSLSEPLAHGEIARDRCIFAGGGALYFLGGSTIHVLRGGRWEAINIGSMELDLQPASKAVVTSWADGLQDPTTRQLVEAVVKDRLQDAASLLVLADHLGDRGDPRGELIALQCLPGANRAQEKRIRELLRDHGDAWMGPLSNVASRGTTVFTAGFLSALTLKQATEKLLPMLRGRPEWATVSRIDAAYWRAPSVIALTGDDALRRLETLAHLRRATALREMGARPWVSLSFHGSLSDDDLAALCTAHDALPQLRHLEVMTEVRGALWSCPLVRQLHALKVVSGRAGLAALVGMWQRELAHLAELTAEPYLGDHGEWGLRFGRTHGITTLALRHKPYARRQDPYEALLALLGTLPAIEVSRVEVGVLQPHPANAPPTDGQRDAIAARAAQWHAVVEWQT